MTSKKNHPGVNNGKRQRWLRANGVSGAQVEVARLMLMTGERAQHPTWRAVRKMIGRLRRKDGVMTLGGFIRVRNPDFEYGSWRRARAV
jgi:hypothetical protein